MSGEIAGAAELRAREVATLRRLCAPVEPLTVTEWADKHRWLPETSTAPGRYRSDVAPYVRRPQDLMGSPDVSLLVMCWASQTLKSTTIENGIGYRIHRMPSPMILLRPKIDDAESWMRERFEPMVRATPVLRERVKLGRAGGSLLRFKRFPGGYLFAASAQSATELASRSSPFGFVDEADRMEMIPGEGNPIEIFARRQGAADIGLLVIASTPRHAETTIIWPYLTEGTHELYELPCPHCGERQPLAWGAREKEFGLRWEHGRWHTAAYLCRGCAKLIDEREKPAMLRAGDWVPTRPNADYPSFHLNGLYSPFAKSGWRVMAEKWEKAQGKPADLQVVVNTFLAEPWEDPAEVTDASVLLARLEPLEEYVVPAGAGALTAGVDVQDKYLEVWVWAWGAMLESWLVAALQLPGDTSRDPAAPGSVWRDLDDVLTRDFVHANGRRIRLDAALVDSGYQTGTVYAYTKARMHRRIFACKGVAGPGLSILGKPSAQGTARVALYPIGTHAAKNEFLRSQIYERTPGPGYVHLPVWLTDEQAAQLVSEKRRTRIEKGRPIQEWVPKTESTHTEGLDCRVYARGALELRGPMFLRRGIVKRAAKWALPPSPTEPPDGPEPGEPDRDAGDDPPLEGGPRRPRPRPPRPRRGFVHRY